MPATLPSESSRESSGNLGDVAPAPPQTQNGANVFSQPGSGQQSPPPPTTNGEPAAKRHVARFITPEKARSQLQLAGDGSLPELTLQESAARPKGEKSSATSNPLVMMAIFGVSALASLLLLLMDTSPRATDVQRQAEARRQIREEFFHNSGDGPQFPEYEIYLRRAQQAHSRGALEDERHWYRKVIELLHAEGKNRYVGLTGTPSLDRRLEELIAEVLQTEP